MGPTGRSRILQIHPTRKCNLRCLHCYSSSGPEESDGLPAALLNEALTAATAEGYTVAGFSGGEPLLYKSLRDVLDHAKDCGMVTTVTTNGMLLDEKRIEMLRGRADLLAISLDGVPESHNRMRAAERAFEIMQGRLEGVRQAGIPFGFIFTLTRQNLHELEPVAAFAKAEGARLLQVHPLEEAGRAKEMLSGFQPDEVMSAYAFLESLRLQSIAGEGMRVHLDLFDRRVLQERPELVYAEDIPRDTTALPLGEIISPLIIQTDGLVVPLQYGFAAHYALGNLYRNGLREMAAEWRHRVLPQFNQLSRRVYSDSVNREGLPLFNWYEVIAREAELEAGAAVAG
jgi:MoaA/NifB/PqqE/SkfB family radical SAM enzyme